ncbi:MAG: SufBD protein [Clostridiales bacterium]|nr:SufBD protein [Clostridiales bacterium]
MMVEITQWTPEEEQRLRDQSSRLTQVEIREFVNRLAGRSNAEAFEALQLLYFRSDAFGDVYPYFDDFAELMESKNSYHRSRGLFLLSINAKWDEEGKLDRIIDRFLSHAEDEKAITARQCLHSLANIIPCKPQLKDTIRAKLTNLDLSRQSENMKPLVMKDTLRILDLL